MCLLVNSFIASKAIETHACYSEVDSSIISTAVAIKPLTNCRGHDNIFDSAVIANEKNYSDDDDNSDSPSDSSIWREVSDCSIDQQHSYESLHHKATSTDHRYFAPLDNSHHSIHQTNTNVFNNNHDNNGPLRPFDLLRCVKRFIGVSGPYNLSALENHFQQRGLDAFIIRWICKGDVNRYSPTEALREFIIAQRSCQHNSPSTALSDFPEVALFHGSCDVTIPSSISSELQAVLIAGGCKNVSLRIYEGWSHTDAILEAPMVGDNRLFRDMSDILYGETERDSSEACRDEALISNTLADIARFVNPF